MLFPVCYIIFYSAVLNVKSFNNIWKCICYQVKWKVAGYEIIYVTCSQLCYNMQKYGKRQIIVKIILKKLEEERNFTVLDMEAYCC